ncbi:isoprenyl transferase [Clostridium sp. CAG:1193]|nr:isoprenyl transferase [Clostridium sp. CAG:1193]
MIPKHVAIIMDGNGRWAEQRGLKRSDGHKAGSEALKKVVEYAFNNGIEVLSVFAFSTENFKRSAEEVNYLMNLFVVVFKKYFNELHNKGIKIVFSKKEEGLPVNLEKLIKDITEKTKNNKKGIFNVCINYGGYDEIIDMTKKISTKVKNNELDINDINAHVINENLYQVLPPIDLVIRTSGEYRISNFMLLQMAYAELYFTNTYFPDFNDTEFEKALNEYKNRNRRFGGNT